MQPPSVHVINWLSSPTWNQESFNTKFDTVRSGIPHSCLCVCWVNGFDVFFLLSGCYLTWTQINYYEAVEGLHLFHEMFSGCFGKTLCLNKSEKLKGFCQNFCCSKSAVKIKRMAHRDSLVYYWMPFKCFGWLICMQLVSPRTRTSLSHGYDSLFNELIFSFLHGAKGESGPSGGGFSGHTSRGYPRVRLRGTGDIWRNKGKPHHV